MARTLAPSARPTNATRLHCLRAERGRIEPARQLLEATTATTAADEKYGGDAPAWAVYCKQPTIAELIRAHRAALDAQDLRWDGLHKSCTTNPETLRNAAGPAAIGAAICCGRAETTAAFLPAATPAPTPAAAASNKPHKEVISVAVMNDGEAIADNNRDKIFTPFFTTRRESGGTGMGLEIVRSMLRAHSGSIDLVAANCGVPFLLTFRAA